MSGAMSPFSFCSLCWYDGPARMAFFLSVFFISLVLFNPFCIRCCRQKKKNISWLTKRVSCPLMCPKPKFQHPSFPKTHIMAREWKFQFLFNATIDGKYTRHFDLECIYTLTLCAHFRFSFIYLTIRLKPETAL